MEQALKETAPIAGLTDDAGSRKGPSRARIGDPKWASFSFSKPVSQMMRVTVRGNNLLFGKSADSEESLVRVRCQRTSSLQGA